MLTEVLICPDVVFDQKIHAWLVQLMSFTVQFHLQILS